ncbi:hypothetical protein AGABI1DRAFT_105442, partial [Agaricus bisporus var. burnettii JB137-S8]
MAGPAEDFVVNSHGPMLIGTVFNLLLFGVMIAQVYFYFTSYARDRLFLKLFVLALFAVDATNSVFNVVFIYVCLVLHFGDADYLKVTNWQFATGDGASFERGRILLNYTRGGNVGPTLTAVIALMVQLFFTWRVYVLTRNRLLVVIVGLLALASAVCGCLTTWEVIAIPQFARFQNFRGIVIVWLAAAACADIMITIILVWHLQKHKTGFRGSDMVVDRIIRLTVQTGLA